MNRIALIANMFSDPSFSKPAIMGLREGQMRPVDHDCGLCGFDRFYGRKPLLESGRVDVLAAPRICRCPELPRMKCDGDRIHNGRWFNGKGEYLGWGDLCSCDLKRI